jgi:hypothetical protein
MTFEVLTGRVFKGWFVTRGDASAAAADLEPDFMTMIELDENPAVSVDRYPSVLTAARLSASQDEADAHDREFDDIVLAYGGFTGLVSNRAPITPEWAEGA